MSEVQPIPEPHKITVTVSADGKVQVHPEWNESVRCGDSVVWLFEGRIDPEKRPVVILESPFSQEAFDEITASGSQVHGRNAREGTWLCRYGFKTESGALEILDAVISGEKPPGVKVIPPPPDGKGN